MAKRSKPGLVSEAVERLAISVRPAPAEPDRLDELKPLRRFRATVLAWLRRISTRQLQRAVDGKIAPPAVLIEMHDAARAFVGARIALAANAARVESRTLQREIEDTLLLTAPQFAGFSIRAEAAALEYIATVRRLTAAAQAVPDCWVALMVDAIAPGADHPTDTLARVVIDELLLQLLQPLLSNAERVMRLDHVRPAQRPEGPKSAAEKEKRAAGRYELDRTTLLTMCVHEGSTLDDAIGQLMRERGLRDAKNYKQRIGVRQLKKQLAQLVKKQKQNPRRLAGSNRR